jgi:glutathione S-transferase
MKLYHSPASPYVRKVVALLREMDRLDEVEMAPTATTPMATDDALKASNPLGKLPALERGDGPTLYDSRVICAFLDDRFGGGLYPQGARRWDTLVLEATADGILDAAVSMVYEGRLRPEAQRSPDWVEAQWAKVTRALDALEARWMAHLGGKLDMGQIAVGCALGYLDFRHGARDWRKGRPALAKWFEAFDARPAMAASRPEG